MTEAPKVIENGNGRIGTKIAAGFTALVTATVGGGAAAPHASAEESGANINPNGAVYEKGEVASQNAVDEYLATVGVKISASSEVSNPSTLSPPEVTVTPTDEKPTPAPMVEPGLPTPTESEEITPTYAKKEQETNEIKNYLVEQGVEENRVDLCADIIYAIRHVNDLSFIEKNVFIYPEKKILGNFITENKVIEYGKTGKGLDVIYFEDQDVKQTDIAAITYIAEEEYKYDIKYIQQSVDMWTEIVPNFLEWMVKMDVRCLFQAVSSENGSGLFKYDPEVIYHDKGKAVNNAAFVAGWRRAFGVEPFGARLESLGIYSGIEIAVLKQALATACCDNLALKIKNEWIVSFAKSYRSTLEEYMEKYKKNISPERMNELIYEIITHPEYAIPYGAENNDWMNVKSDIITNAIEWNTKVSGSN